MVFSAFFSSIYSIDNQSTSQNLTSQNIILINTGKLNRYLYDYSNTNYTNELPSWNNFGSPEYVTNGSVPNSGDYWTYFFDGYIIYSSQTTMYFGLASDDDSFLWIIKGNKKWSTIGHPDASPYTYIEDNITDATLVCDDKGLHGITGSYSGHRNGSYTFEANTLYTILLKVTEHGGGSGLYFGISNQSLNNASRINSTFPSEFCSDFNNFDLNDLSFSTYTNSTDKINFDSIIYFNNNFIAFTTNGHIKYGSSLSNINENTKQITDIANCQKVSVFIYNNIIYAAYHYHSLSDNTLNYTIYSTNGIDFSNIIYDTSQLLDSRPRWSSYIIDNSNAYVFNQFYDILNVSDPLNASLYSYSSNLKQKNSAGIYIPTLNYYIFYPPGSSRILYGNEFSSLTQTDRYLDNGNITDFAYGIINNNTVIVGVGPNSGNGSSQGNRVKYGNDGYTFNIASVGINNNNQFTRVIFIEEMKVFLASSQGKFDGGDITQNMIYSYDGINWNKITTGYIKDIYWYKNNNIGYILAINSNGDIFKSQEIYLKVKNLIFNT